MNKIADFEVSGTASIDGERLITSVDEILNKFDELKVKIDELDAKLDELGQKEVKINVLIEGMEKLDELKLFLDEIESHEYTAKIKVDVEDKDKLDKLYIDILELELYDHNVKVKVETDGIAEAEAKIQALDKTLDDNKKKTDAAKDSANKFKFSWMLLAPALIPVVGIMETVVGGALGLAAAFGAMAIPVLASVYTLKSYFTQMSAVSSGLSASAQAAAGAATSYQQMYNILNKNSAAFKQMDPIMQRVTTDYMLFQNALSNFQQAVEPWLVPVIIQGFNVLSQILTILIPMVDAVGGAFTKFLNDFSNRLRDPVFTKWFSDIDKNLGTLVTDWLGAVLNIVEGITAILDAFLPLGVKMSGGFLKMTQDFDTWAQHLSQSKGFKDFVHMVETDGPILLNVLGQVILFIGNLVKALSSTGATTGFLKTLDNILKTLNGFMSAHPGVAKVVADLFLFGLAASKLGPLLGPIMAFLATPVGAIVGVILALAAAFFLLYKNSKAFRDWVNTNLKPMWTSMTHDVGQAQTALTALWPTVKQIWNRYLPQLTLIVKGEFKNVLGTISGVLQIILGVIQLFAGILSGKWSLIWTGLENILLGFNKIIISMISGLGTIVIGLFEMLGKVVWGLIGKYVSQWIADFVTFIAQAITRFISFGSNLYNQMRNALAQVAVAVASGLVGVLNWFARLPGQILNALGNLGSLLFNAGINVINGFINGIESAIPSLSSVLNSITNLIPSLKGPPSRDRELLKNNGQLVIMGFIDGLESKYSAVEKSLGTFTNNLGTTMGKKLTTDISARINGGLVGSSGGVAGAMGAGVAGAAGGGSGATQVTFAPGAIQINNPVAEQPGITLTRTMQGAAKFGTIQGTAGSRMT